MSVAIRLKPEPPSWRPPSGADSLRERWAVLVEKRAALIEHVKPTIAARYQELFGEQEFELLQLSAARRRLQRKIELIRAALARVSVDGRVRLGAIEAQLDDEFEDWERRLERKAFQLAEAERRTSAPRLDAVAAARLKATYRRLVRLLHPDMTNGPSRPFDKYWDDVQRAYANGDPDRLELILLRVSERTGGANVDDDLDVEATARWRQRIHALELEIEALCAQPPFDMKDKLCDKEWVSCSRAKLASRIVAESAAIPGLEKLATELEAAVAGSSGQIH